MTSKCKITRDESDEAKEGSSMPKTLVSLC